MKQIIGWWKAESAALVALALAVVGAGVVTGTWQRVLLAVLPLVGGVAVRQTVFSPPAVQRIVEGAAIGVASQLTPDVVGATGVVGPAAQAVIDGVVAGAVG